MFCENVVTLIGWMCKSYSTFGLFNMNCSSPFFFFFPIIDLCSFFYSIFALFIQHFSLFIKFHNIFALLYWHNKFYYKKLQCVNNGTLVCSIGTVATVATTNFFFSVFCLYFFFSFNYWSEPVYILLYWNNKFHNIFTIIEGSISYKLK